MRRDCLDERDGCECDCHEDAGPRSPRDQLDLGTVDLYRQFYGMD
jgi:hypothetical protein